MSRFHLLLPLPLLALGGCITLGPDYSRPSLPPDIVEGWGETTTVATSPIDADWWAVFGDPLLDGLIRQALEHNQDLLLAAARLAEAEALAGRARADRYPELGVNGGISESESVSGFGGISGDSDPALRTKRRALSATLDFELDLLGRLRRAEEATHAELLGSAATARALQLAVASDVARSWFERTSLARERELFLGTLEGRRSTLELLQQRFDAGLIAGVELDRATAEVAATEASLPALELAERRVEHRLAVLLGTAPSALELPAIPSELVAPPAIPAGLPATLLDRRPDLVAAEARLSAATARIGVAKAELYPRLSLTGAYGHESLELGSFVSASSAVWNLGANLVGSIFGFGRNHAHLAAAEARTDQALASWRGAVLDALREVEDALVARRTQAERAGALERQATALEITVAAERSRYLAGEASYFEVLDAERGWLGAQAQALDARRATLVASVDLIQALGGGWNEAASE